ncbi:MAG: PilZ domain-containing protein [Bryobacteraceae bacterium]
MRPKSTSTDSSREKRRSARTSKTGKVKLSWTSNGQERMALGDLLDISTGGMRISTLDRLPQGTAIRFQSETIRLHGSAIVRHCTQKGLRYVLGVEFLGGLTWSGQ